MLAWPSGGGIVDVHQVSEGKRERSNDLEFREIARSYGNAVSDALPVIRFSRHYVLIVPMVTVIKDIDVKPYVSYYPLVRNFDSKNSVPNIRKSTGIYERNVNAHNLWPGAGRTRQPYTWANGVPLLAA